MSDENASVVRRGWEAWSRGDLDGLLALLDSEVVWDTKHFRDWPETEYRGQEGVRRFLTEWLEVWGDDYQVGVDEIRVAPDGRVVSLHWHRGTGRQSGVTMELQVAQIATVRDGRIIRLDNYDDRTKALKAAGLSE
ncbi:MAG: nuclear transport factor 2 family protein [Solirubrobacterales bacterium]